ncbi:MAG: hypothetical protein ACI4JM_00100, partial [Oscillospiraceae bacterium]
LFCWFSLYLPDHLDKVDTKNRRRRLAAKSWTKTFIFVALFTYNFFLMARPHNAELTNAVEPINNVSSETKPLKAACYEPEAATCRNNPNSLLSALFSYNSRYLFVELAINYIFS